MNSSTYGHLLRIFERWPLDKGKSGRDFGEFIRKQVSQYFSISKGGQINLSAWDEIGLRLGHIESDIYRKKFAVSRSATSTGMSETECALILTNESLAVLQEHSSSNFYRAKMIYMYIKTKIFSKTN